MDESAVQALNAIATAINNLANVIQENGLPVSATAGSSAGKYISVQGDDGTTYKVALLNAS